MTRLLAVRRHQEIVRRLQAVGAVSVSEIAVAFSVSQETIRRDLKHLADLGHLDIVHGGAVRHGGTGNNITVHEPENSHGKSLIAKAAAGLVPQGCCLLLDAGAISSGIVKELAQRSGLTICTNSLENAAALSRVDGNRVHMLGGEIEPKIGATVSMETAEAVRAFQADIVLIEIGGFADDGAPTDLSRVAAELHGRMALAGATYIVADHVKFSQRLPFRVPNFESIKGIIVDRAPDKHLVASWDDKGIKLIVAN
jgi:DeoR/GlpR family transcriptional regulator of sugar metabolism